MALTKIDDRGLKTPIDLLDNEKIRLGTGNDLEIYHDGSDSRLVDSGTGELRLDSNSLRIRNAAGTETSAIFVQDGACELRYDNVKKLETTSDGATVSGDLTIDGSTPELRMKVTDDSQSHRINFYNTADSIVSRIFAEPSGNISIRNGTNAAEECIKCLQNGAVELYHDNTKRFETTSSGATVTGSLGIGTTSPTNQLHVYDSAAANDTPEIKIESYRPAIRFKDRSSSSVSAEIVGDDSLKFSVSTPVDDSTALTQRMRIDSDGRVAISSTGTYFDTNTMLEVVGKTGAGPNLVLHRNDTTVSNNQVLAALRVTGNDNDGSTQQEAAAIEFAADGDHANNDKPGRIVLKTTSDGGSSSSERIRIDSSGRVGIGTTTGAVGGAPSSQTGQFNVTSAAGSGQWAMQARADNTAGNGLFLRAGNSSSYYTAYLTGYDENNVHMVVRGDGNIGIGTSSPSTPLHVSTNTDGTSDLLTLHADADGTNNGIASIKFTGNTGNHAAFIKGGHTTNGDSILTFHTDAHASGINPQERMRVNSDGNVLIGTTSNDGDGLSIRPRQYHGTTRIIFNRGNTSDNGTAVQFLNNDVTVGTIKYSNSETQFNTTSDYRLKENATAISDGIARLKTLKPYRFNFKVNASKTVDGFFAHEVTAVPEAISGTKDEVVTQAMIDSGEHKEGTLNDPIYQGIDQSKLVPLLTAALQEAVGKIETLETKVAALEAA